MAVRHFSIGRPVAELAAQARSEGAELVRLCGPYFQEAREFRAYLSTVPEGWRVVVRQAEADGECEAYLWDREDNRTRFVSLASWWSEPMDPHRAAGELGRLHGALSRAFHRDSSPIPMRSPAACGVDLWRAEQEDSFPPLAEEDQTLIRATSGQGRQEYLALERWAPALEYWDMRLAYPSLMENLPVGPAERRELRILEPSTRGRVRVRATVPKDWQHVGLLPWKRPHHSLSYPCAKGYQFETWCDASEARFALAQGWGVEPLELLQLQEGRPLDTWSRRLKRLWAYYDERGEDHLADAVRAILIQALGDLQGRGRSAEELVASAYRDAEPVVMHRPMARRKERPSHPEWTAAVWARCRYRLTKAMLSVPRSLLLGCYLDCVYLGGEPGWPDSRELGHFRRKNQLEGPIVLPRTLKELGRLAKGEQE